MKNLSIKINVIKFLAICLVVGEHAFFISDEKFYQQGIFKWNEFIQKFFSTGICKISVPLFFMISGYLFFNSSKSYFEKIRGRFYSLFIPYFIFSILYSIPVFIKDVYFLDKSLAYTEIFIKIFGNNPIAYQLWYIRDLIILILLSPFFYWVLKNKKSALLFLILFFLVYLFIPVDNNFNRIYGGLFFFYFGAWSTTNIKKIQVLDISKPFLVVSLFFWISLLVLIQSINLLEDFLIKISICFGIISLWNIYDILMKLGKKSQVLLNELSSYSFAIYLFHAPYLIYSIRILLFKLLGVENEYIHIVIYFLSVPLTILICIVIARILKNKTPKIYNILTGNR